MSQQPIPQIPGCLPQGYDLDSLLTPEQFAVWRQLAESTVRAMLPTMKGVIMSEWASDLQCQNWPKGY